MKLLSELRAQGRGQDMAAVLEHIPYARFLGIQVERKGNELTTILPFQEHLIGNVNLPALHGRSQANGLAVCEANCTAGPSARSWSSPP